MIVVNIIFCIAFLWFTYLNFNDPDAWLWVTIYLFAACCCGAAASGFYFPVAWLIAVAFYLAYALVLFFVRDGVWDWITKYRAQNIAATMQATSPWIEKTREFFGLLIISGALLINYFVYR